MERAHTNGGLCPQRETCRWPLGKPRCKKIMLKWLQNLPWTSSSIGLTGMFHQCWMGLAGKRVAKFDMGSKVSLTHTLYECARPRHPHWMSSLCHRSSHFAGCWMSGTQAVMRPRKGRPCVGLWKYSVRLMRPLSCYAESVARVRQTFNPKHSAHLFPTHILNEPLRNSSEKSPARTHAAPWTDTGGAKTRSEERACPRLLLQRFPFKVATCTTPSYCKPTEFNCTSGSLGGRLWKGSSPPTGHARNSGAIFRHIYASLPPPKMSGRWIMRQVPMC